MDMQNVSNLQIPEGMVKTIHDKDNRLLWGAVGYNTKYAGDTYQQIYSGKNLFDKDNATLLEAYFDGSHTSLTGASTNRTTYLKVRPNTTYTISKLLSVRNFIGTTQTEPTVGTSVSNIANIGNGNYDGVTRVSGTLTTGSNDNYIVVNYTNTNTETGDIQTNILNSIQIEDGPTATSFEPYVGGIPSPNPSYPQNIDVVTGAQVISITDGTNTQNLTVDLGSTELCKIGTYQDYIYKSGDDWYVHKEIGKTDMSAITQGWANRNADGDIYNTWFIGSFGVAIAPVVSNIFTYSSTVWGGVGKFGITNIGNLWLQTGDSTVNSSTIATWFTNKSAVIYYALATPSDTKITDSTLISQLNAIHEWLTRYGYYGTVSGNLPIIVSRTNL